MNNRMPVVAAAIAAAALTASMPAYADSCNQSTYVRGDGNYVVNKCIVVQDTGRDAYPTDYPSQGYYPSQPYYPSQVYYPSQSYYPAQVYPARVMYGPRPMPFFFRGFRR